MAPARPIRDLSCDEPFRRAAGKVIWTRFEEMMSLRAAALDSKEREGVHDMRVATRRLRAALELFRDAFPANRFRPMLAEVKEMADALGKVRDLEVMVQRLEADRTGRPLSQRLALDELLGQLRTEHRAARRELKRFLESPAQQDLSRRFLAVVAQETM